MTPASRHSDHIASPEVFHYTALRDIHECIRLLRILPGRHEDEVECQLYEVEIENCPPFEALSYVWGARSANDPIIKVDDSNFQVTRNCYNATVHLRGISCARVVWIDAICIDQENVLEKNAQVERLGAMYGRAQRTIIWLGIPDRPTPLLAKLDDLTLIWMLQQAWWTRVWIIQELCLSRTPVLLVERHEVPWADLEAAIQEFVADKPKNAPWELSRVIHMGTGGPFSSRIVLRAEALVDMRHRIRAVNHAENEGLLELLILFQYYQSGRKRDKVFSLLNLARDTCGIRADYNQARIEAKEAEIFRTTAVQIIRTYKHVNILGQVYRSEAEREPLEDHLPTWVPHWNRGENLNLRAENRDHSWHNERRNKHRDLIVEDTLAHMLFGGKRPSASGPRTELKPLELDRMTAPDLPSFALRIPGIVIDTIVTVGNLLPPLIPEAESPLFQSSVQGLQSWLEAPGALWSASRQKEHKEALISEIKKRAYVFGEMIRVLRGWHALAVDAEYDDDEVPASAPYPLSSASSPPPPFRPQRLKRFQRFLATISRGSEVESASYKDWDVIFGAHRGLGDRFWMFLGRVWWKYFLSETKDADEDIRLGKSMILLINRHLLKFNRLLSVFRGAFNFKLARTEGGYLALVPELTAPGDSLVLLATAGSPYIARSASPERSEGHEGCLEMVGWCYAPGLMSGERWCDEHLIDIVLV